MFAPLYFRPPCSCHHVHGATPTWRLHTGLYKFVQNISTNIWGSGKRRLKTGRSVFFIDHLTISWLYSLNGFRIISLIAWRCKSIISWRRTWFVVVVHIDWHRLYHAYVVFSVKLDIYTEITVTGNLKRNNAKNIMSCDFLCLLRSNYSSIRLLECSLWKFVSS